MIESKLKTFYADIYLGLQEGYGEGLIHTSENVKNICQKYVEKGLCVTLTLTEFIYTGGREPGVIIGLINYPRFPSSMGEVLSEANNLAHILMEELKQFRCTIVTPQKTYLLSNDNMPEEFQDKS